MSYPEAVALAEILTDLDWRRHVAIVRDRKLDRFDRRVGTRLREPGIRPYSWGYDPMDAWIQRQRKKYASTRKEFWATPRFSGRPNRSRKKASSDETDTQRSRSAKMANRRSEGWTVARSNETNTRSRP